MRYGICLHHIKQLYAIDLSSLISLLYVVKKGDKRKMNSPIHGDYDGASCNTVSNIQPTIFVNACNIYFPIFSFVVAT